MSVLPPSISERILAEGGSVPFARFMELALTDTDAGYYARGALFLGEKGDFTTAPRRVPAFSRAIARFLADLIDVIPAGPVTVVEVGAGEGDLGAGVLEWWTAGRPDLRDRVTYLVDDVAEASRRRQAAALGAAAAGGWRVGIRGESPREGGPVAAAERGPRADPGVDTATATGIVVTNELFDALPVHVVDVRGEIPMEAWVEVETGPGDRSGVVEAWKELSPEAARELEVIAPGCSVSEVRALTAGGFLELRPGAGALLDRWCGWHEDLAVLTIDYGDWLAGPTAGTPPHAPGDRDGVTCLKRLLKNDASPREYTGYAQGKDAGSARSSATGATEDDAWRRPVRSRGRGFVLQQPLKAALHRRSLRGYYRHHVTHDPYQYVGRQDLTADVDFRALALHGEARGFETVLFTTLAAFLHTAGAREEVRPESKAGERYTLQADMDGAPLAGLLDADGLGGLFKVMLQVKERDGS